MFIQRADVLHAAGINKMASIRHTSILSIIFRHIFCPTTCLAALQSHAQKKYTKYKMFGNGVLLSEICIAVFP